MNKIKYFFIALAAAFSFLTVLSPAPALAQCDPSTPAGAVQCGACGASGQPACESEQATRSINATIESIINILSVAIGVIAVIVIILAGFRYITSGGNEQAITAAKKTLTYAIIGLVIVALAQVIVRFVLDASTRTS